MKKIFLFIFKFFIPIFSFSFLLNCNDSNITNPDLKTGPYFPLGIGNKWEFIPERADLRDFKQKWEVTKDTTYDGQKYFVIESSYEGSNSDSYIYFARVDSSNVLRLLEAGGIRTKLMDLEIPNDSSYTQAQYNVIFRKLGDITIEGRKYYNCIEFVFNVPHIADVRTAYTFSPRIGIIRLSNDSIGASNLVSYKINNL